MAVRMPQSEPLTVTDVADPPDDGHRYELIDGCLIVTPSSSARHQRVSGNLHHVLRAAVPADLEVFSAPFDWVIDERTKLQPDLLVFRRTDVDDDALRVPPVVAIEILSPSTRRLDLGTKRLVVAAGGAAYYWIVDPLTPSFTAFALVDGNFVEVAQVAGAERATLTEPFPVAICPADLLT